MSAAELLHGLQPACASSARCKPAAMGQCARGRQWSGGAVVMLQLIDIEIDTG